MKTARFAAVAILAGRLSLAETCECSEKRQAGREGRLVKFYSCS